MCHTMTLIITRESQMSMVPRVVRIETPNVGFDVKSVPKNGINVYLIFPTRKRYEKMFQRCANILQMYKWKWKWKHKGPASIIFYLLKQINVVGPLKN